MASLHPSLSDALRILEPEPEVHEALAGVIDIPAALDRLIAANMYREAYRLVALSIPFRDAVWWGCLCVWDEARPRVVQRADFGPDWPKSEDAALQAAYQWVEAPNDDRAKGARVAGEVLGVGVPAGAIALAIAWNALEPDSRRRSCFAVAGAALLAALRGGPDAPEERIRRYLGLALMVARRELDWK